MNCLISKQGKMVECQGADHRILSVKIFKQQLGKFLCTGGCRIKVHFDVLAIEAGQKLTAIQLSIVNSILRNNEIYEIVRQINGEFNRKESFRRIRRLEQC